MWLSKTTIKGAVHDEGQHDRFIGAQSVLRWARPGKSSAWITALLDRRPRKVAAVALANKMARIAWALMARRERYRAPGIVTAAA